MPIAITPSMMKRYLGCWSENKVVRDGVSDNQPPGFQPTLAVQLINTHRDETTYATGEGIGSMEYADT